ncbi:hypothetical protein EVAR_45583_1 [Eumeta japonica]|uniref:Uncharacterized protein n=1 Tax=Eumeta variegata TaxID=151549 RepID=A0A4C1YYZ9_EUMVA|nr:hypothetical protein EVAR_45583_1 [Eumeta japonica]
MRDHARASPAGGRGSRRRPPQLNRYTAIMSDPRHSDGLREIKRGPPPAKRARLTAAAKILTRTSYFNRPAAGACPLTWNEGLEILSLSRMRSAGVKR